MSVSPSQPESVSTVLRWQNARPVRGFILGVYLGGFVAWVIMCIVIISVELLKGGSSQWHIFIPATVALCVAYCAMIVIVFFFLPMITLRLGRRYPIWARPITLAISMLSSLIIWCTILLLLGIPPNDEVEPVLVASIVCSLVGGAVAGHYFWKKSFPPLAELSAIFQ